MASGRLAAAVALVMMASGAAHAAPGSACVGRYALVRASGTLVDRTRDLLVLDATSAVIDPGCGAATVAARGGHGRTRIAAHWSQCRGARSFRLQLRASADCTLLRGTISGHGRRSRIVAVTSSCGDGVVDAGLGERCDDGNMLDGDGCDATCGRCSGPTSFAATWDAIQANVFDRSCTTCHGANASGGLDLRAPDSYGRIVGVTAPDSPGFVYVSPGERATSFVWLKIAKGALGGHDDVAGPGMPIGPPIATDLVEALGRWIDAGAPQTGIVPDTDALTAPCR